MTPEAFADWGWRVPFLVSILLLAVSIWIRLQLAESPAFTKMKAEGTGSKAPLKEAFGRWENAKVALLALLGGTAGQAVVWYCGQFYALFFLTQSLKMDGTTANILIAASLAIGTPFFIFFGWLSDKIGRKPIILAGCLIAAITYFPLFGALAKYANPDLVAAQERAPVSVTADPARCSFQFNPVGTASFTTSCDVVKSFLARNSVNYRNETAPAGTVASVKIGDKVIQGFDVTGLPPAEAKAKTDALTKDMTAAIREAGYPAAFDPAKANKPILTILVIYVTMVYGADRGDAGRAVPDPHPLHRHVAALPHRQRLVRRLPASDRLRHRGGDRRHLLGPLVPDRRRPHDLRDRPPVRAGDEGPRHLHLRGGEALIARSRPTNRSPGASRGFFLAARDADSAAGGDAADDPAFAVDPELLSRREAAAVLALADRRGRCGIEPFGRLAAAALHRREGGLRRFLRLLGLCLAHRAAGNKEDRREGERGGRERGPRAGVAFHGGLFPWIARGGVVSRSFIENPQTTLLFLCDGAHVARTKRRYVAGPQCPRGAAMTAPRPAASRRRRSRRAARATARASARSGVSGNTRAAAR